MRHYFQVFCENGEPKFRFDLKKLKDLVVPKFTGELCLLLLPQDQYRALSTLVKATRAWKQSQNDIAEKPTFGYDRIMEKNNLKLWNSINELDKLLPL